METKHVQSITVFTLNSRVISCLNKELRSFKEKYLVIIVVYWTVKGTTSLWISSQLDVIRSSVIVATVNVVGCVGSHPSTRPSAFRGIRSKKLILRGRERGVSLAAEPLGEVVTEDGGTGLSKRLIGYTEAWKPPVGAAAGVTANEVKFWRTGKVAQWSSAWTRRTTHNYARRTNQTIDSLPLKFVGGSLSILELSSQSFLIFKK